MKLYLLVASLTFALTAQADIRVGGGVLETQSIPFREGMTLTDALTGQERFTCSLVSVSRRDKTEYIVALGLLMERFGPDFPLADGDRLSVRQHIFPCMPDDNGRAFGQLISEYNALKRAGQPAPKDWVDRVKAAAGSCTARERKNAATEK